MEKTPHVHDVVDLLVQMNGTLSISTLYVSKWCFTLENSGTLQHLIAKAADGGKLEHLAIDHLWIIPSVRGHHQVFKSADTEMADLNLSCCSSLRSLLLRVHLDVVNEGLGLLRSSRIFQSVFNLPKISALEICTLRIDTNRPVAPESVFVNVLKAHLSALVKALFKLANLKEVRVQWSIPQEYGQENVPLTAIEAEMPLISGRLLFRQEIVEPEDM